MKTITQIAEEVRVWGELLECNGICFENLRGLCAICSVELFIRLQKEGYKPLFCFNTCHAFVVVDNKIVDVTASQFSLYRNTKILICDADDDRLTMEHDQEIVCDNISDIIDELDDVGWPEEIHPQYFHVCWEVPAELCGTFQKEQIYVNRNI